MLDELYVSPQASLSHYQRVVLDPIEVTFKDGWRQQHPDMSDRDLDHFRGQLAQGLRKTLVDELVRGGYVIAEAPAQDVIRLRASIVDADFPAPEIGGDRIASGPFDGGMTLRVRGFDSPSGALVARARDHEEAGDIRNLHRADRVRAMLTAQRIFDDWARELRSALDVARVSAGARAPQR